MLKIIVENFKFEKNYFTKLLGFIHKSFGQNTIHDTISLYSYSNIYNNSFFFNSYDKELQKKLIDGILKDNNIFDNCNVIKILQEEDIIREVYKSYSPFFIKNNLNQHLIYKDAEQFAKKIILKKMQIANFKSNDFNIEFINFKQTKLIKIHDINNRCFISDVVIHADNETHKFIKQVGIGNSTGCGFGYIN